MTFPIFSRKYSFFLLFLFLSSSTLLTVMPCWANPEKHSGVEEARFAFSSEQDIYAAQPISNQVIYRIPLRIHLGESQLGQAELEDILWEINGIWWTQAGICFDIEIVHHEQIMDVGLDLWFGGKFSSLNGYYAGPHEIKVRDYPVSSPSLLPANYGAARTAAHELGHALSLSHRQNSDSNLMRSKTDGWALNAEEIVQARAIAARIGILDSSFAQCPIPSFFATDTLLLAED